MFKSKTKKNEKGITRRNFIKGTMVIGSTATLGSLVFPNILRGAAPPEVLIGHIHPLSGFLAMPANEIKTGLLMAVSEINDSGGIKSLGGAKLKLVDADSEGKPDRAISEVERLYRAGVSAITGSLQSGVTLVATQVAEKFRVPFVISLSVDDKITSRGFKYTFRHMPNAEQMGSQTVKYISEISKTAGVTVKTIAHLYDNTAFGTSLADHVSKYAPQYGIEVILGVPYSPSAADLSTEVGKIKLAGADVVVSTGYFDDGIRILRAYKNLRVKSKGFIGCGSSAYSHPKLVDELGPLAEYVMDCNFHDNPRSPMTQKAFAHYREIYGTDMAHHTVQAYQAIYVIADAIERAKSTDREAVREALTKTHIVNHTQPYGPIIFGPDGQNKNAAAALMQVLEGKIRVVWPEQYSQAKPVFPHPA